MPKSRQPKEVWRETRRKVWGRDGRRCVRCLMPQRLDECHIDHIKSGKNAGNEMPNLRTLCRYCHVLRADIRHRGMIGKALQDGTIPADWRGLVWEDI